MALQYFKVVLLYVVGILLIEVACEGVVIKSLDVETKPNNGYFGNITNEIKSVESSSSSISATVPITKELDQKLQVKLDFNFKKIPILKDYIVSLCDSIFKEQLFKDLSQKIEPSGKFPSQCPIPAGEWKLTDYAIDLKNILPLGFAPSGDFDLEAEIGMPDSEPLVKIMAVGTVSAPSSLGSLFKLL